MKYKISTILLIIVLQMVITSCEKGSVSTTLTSQLTGTTWNQVSKIDSFITIDSIGNIITRPVLKTVLKFDENKFSILDTTDVSSGFFVGTWSADDNNSKLSLKYLYKTNPEIWTITYIDDNRLEMYKDTVTYKRSYTKKH
jgi:hypothetical protein